MIIKKEIIKGVAVYTVDKDFDDAAMEKRLNKFVKPADIKTIIDHDADVITADGRLLLRFRKSRLIPDHVEDFYDNVIKFAKNVSSNRGNATGSKKRDLATNPKVMSNIFGYFDRWTPSHKVVFRQKGFKPMVDVRECRFNQESPDKYKKTIPLIKDIDHLYKELTPEQHRLQMKKANETPFRIPGTSFTTVTTNVNFQTSVHTDKGDDIDGFGNLAVIERGAYTGGETCFPQYGLGVDVRTGDILFMDVHQPHANLPIQKKTEDAIRLSIVCYLRKNVWLRTRGKTRRFYERHNKTLKNLKNKKG
jgi:hypothetical protein